MSTAGAGQPAKPLLTLDFDGVICHPLSRANPGIRREFLDPHAPPDRALVLPRWLGAPIDRARFDFRRPMPGVRDALIELATVRRLVIVTGRRSQPTRWLRRHGLDGLVEDVVVNRTALRSPHFKLATLRALRADEHVEDDPRTAQLLAQAAGMPVYLVDWPRNRDLSFDPLVRRVDGLPDLARLLRGLDG